MGRSIKSKSLIITCLVMTLIILAAITIGCSSRFVPGSGDSSTAVASPPKPTNGMVQTNTAGSVTFDVEWVRSGDAYLAFNVAMNTHSVDLDQYDLGKLAVLRDDTGKEYSPISWDSAPGGHHRRGVLAFPVPDSLSQENAKYLEIVIRDVAGIGQRVLKWEL